MKSKQSIWRELLAFAFCFHFDVSQFCKVIFSYTRIFSFVVSVVFFCLYFFFSIFLWTSGFKSFLSCSAGFYFAILYGQILHRYDSLFFRRMGKRFSAKKKERLGEIGVQSSRWIHYEKWIKINEKENVEKEKEREFPPCFRQIPFSSI